MNPTTNVTRNNRQRPKFGQLLVNRGVLNEKQLTQLLDVQRRHPLRTRLGDLALEYGLADPDDIAAVLEQQLGIPQANPDNLHPDPELLQRVEPRIMTDNVALPIRLDDGTLHLAMADPTDTATWQLLGRLCGATAVQVQVAETRALTGRIHDLLNTPNNNSAGEDTSATAATDSQQDVDAANPDVAVDQVVIAAHRTAAGAQDPMGFLTSLHDAMTDASHTYVQQLNPTQLQQLAAHLLADEAARQYRQLLTRLQPERHTD